MVDAIYLKLLFLYSGEDSGIVDMKKMVLCVGIITIFISISSCGVKGNDALKQNENTFKKGCFLDSDQAFVYLASADIDPNARLKSPEAMGAETATIYNVVKTTSIRVMPDDDAVKLANIRAGNEVSVIGSIDDKWAKIVFHGRIAYILLESLENGETIERAEEITTELDDSSGIEDDIVAILNNQHKEETNIVQVAEEHAVAIGQVDRTETSVTHSTREPSTTSTGRQETASSRDNEESSLKENDEVVSRAEETLASTSESVMSTETEEESAVTPTTSESETTSSEVVSTNEETQPEASEVPVQPEPSDDTPSEPENQNPGDGQ